jgi:glycerol-3-phosphate acyltransferase PlsY
MHVAAVAPAPFDTAYAQSALCGFAAVVGHCWPLFFGFRGGKGAATAVGAVIVLAPILVLPILAVWGLVLIASGYVGLATIVAGGTLAVLASITMAVANTAPALTGFSVATALLIVFTHRDNIRRLARGEEYRFEKARLLRRPGPRS